jgi:hypothetical protein
MTDASQVKSFRNMNELTSYLSSMEIRLATLESENKALRNALGQVKQSAAVSTLIIGIPMFICYLIFFFAMMSNMDF